MDIQHGRSWAETQLAGVAHVVDAASDGYTKSVLISASDTLNLALDRTSRWAVAVASGLWSTWWWWTDIFSIRLQATDDQAYPDFVPPRAFCGVVWSQTLRMVWLQALVTA